MNTFFQKLFNHYVIVLGLMMSIVSSVKAQDNATTQQTSENRFNLSEAVEVATIEDMLFNPFPIVNTATFKPTMLDMNPGSMTVITETDIKAYGLDTLIDLYHLIPGISIDKHSTSQFRACFRGSDSYQGEVIWLLDGHPLNNRFDNMIFSWQYMSLDNVKQVEIIRGPGATLWGTGAFSGVINVITKRDAGTSVKVEAGEWNNRRLDIIRNLNKKDDGLQFGVHISSFEEVVPNIEIERDALNGSPFSLTAKGPAKKDRAQDRSSISVSTSYQNLDFTYHYADSEIAWVPGFGNVLSDRDWTSKEKAHIGVLNYKLKFNDNFSIKITSDYSLNKIEIGGSATPYISLGRDVNGDGLVESWPIGWEMLGFLDDELWNNKALLNFEFEKHSFNIGLSYSLVNSRVNDERNVRFMQDAANYGTPIFIPESMRKTKNISDMWLDTELDNEDIISILYQDEWFLSEHLSLIYGIRYDKFTELDNKPTTTPRFHIVWGLNDDWIIKGGYSTAFAIPSYSSRFLNNISAYDGIPDLKNEVL